MWIFKRDGRKEPGQSLLIDPLVTAEILQWLSTRSPLELTNSPTDWTLTSSSLLRSLRRSSPAYTLV